jgi:hypothetical protein
MFDSAIDPDGNLLVCGQFEKVVDVDITSSAKFITCNTGSDYYVAKYKQSQELMWVHTSSQTSTLDEGAFNITSDHEGNVYVMGTETGPSASFVLKLSPSGSVVWKKYFSFIKYYGTQVSYAYVSDVVAEDDGAVTLIGNYSDSTDFDPGPAKFVLPAKGGNNVFFVRLNANGQFQWVKTIAPVNNLNASDVSYRSEVADREGNLYLLGSFSDTIDFDPDTGTFTLQSSDDANIFLAKYTSDLDLIWAKQFTGEYDEWGPVYLRGDMAIDGHDSLHVLIPAKVGVYDPTGENYTFTGISNKSQRYVKLDADGRFIRSFQIGSGQEYGEIFAYPDGSFLITACTEPNGDIDPSAEGAMIFNESDEYGEITYMAKFDLPGNYLWSRWLSYSGFNLLPTTPDTSGNIFLVSSTSYDRSLVGENGFSVEKYPAESVGFILKYGPPNCDSMAEDYMIRDNVGDVGLEPNEINLPSWQGPAIRNNQPLHYRPDYVDYSQADKMGIEVKITKRGCNTAKTAKLEVYYSAAPEGLTWPDNWNEFYVDIGGNQVQAGGKIGEIEIPVLYNRDVWEGTVKYTAPLDPAVYSAGPVKLGILARIVSPDDPDYNTNPTNLLEFATHNNNIAWRLFELQH